jgi:ABC-type transporter Mla subunit MlaD
MQNNDAFFDWQLLLPQQGPLYLLQNGVHSTGDLGAAFIWLTLCLFGLALFWLTLRAFRAMRAIGFLRELAKRANPEKLPQQRRDLRLLAAKQAWPGQLWLAFDATWVETQERLYQTAEAGEFFNPHTLAPGIMDNRLLAAIPGILTAFGILGTFVGLQIGLSTLDFANPQNLNQSIVPLIQGAAVAFSTSVWGTAASVLFNFFEKSVEQMLRRRIEALRGQANALFSAHVPEQTLLNIERAGVEAENALKGLAEQIGQRMQEALLQMPAQIQNGIETAMAPAIDKLVHAAEQLAQRQGSQAQEALSAMIEKFVGSVAASGENSRQGLEQASQQLGASLGQWSSSMEAFLERLDSRATAFDSQMGDLLEQGKELRQETGVSQQFLAAVAGELQKGSELLQRATQDLQRFGQDMQATVKVFSQTHAEVAKLAESAAHKQHEAGETLARIAQTLDQANDGLLVSSESLKNSAATAKAGFDELNQMQRENLEGLRKALNNLRKQIGQMMQDYATDVQEQTKNRLEQWNAQTQEFSKSMVTAVQAMHEILGEIDLLLAQRRGEKK